jgi:hypothetical protein
MKNFERINHVLANYFSSTVEYSEDEALASLARSLDRNPTLLACLREEVRDSMADPSFSWTDALADNNVFVATSEDEARGYASKLFAVVIRPD